MREHTEVLRPPRALWVTFELGRPFGMPNDAPFQRRVVAAALDLLAAPAGPVIADYPEHAGEADMTGWACPISFGAAAKGPDDIGSAVAREIGELAPWYDRARTTTGRTTVGVSGLPVGDAAAFLVACLDGASPPTPPAGAALGDTIKRACEDLKAYYIEALTAQPGGAGTMHQQGEWLWGETALGRLLVDLYPVLTASPDPAVQWVGVRLLVPATQLHRVKGPIHPRSH